MTLLLVLLCQSTVLLALGLLALRLSRKRGPAVQTLVGRATLSGVLLLLLLLPLSGRIAPVWRIPTPVRPSPALPLREGAEVQPVGALPAAPSKLAAPSVAPAPSAPPSVSIPAAVSAPGPVELARQEGAASLEGAASSAPTPVRPHPSFRKDPATEARGSKAVGLLLLPTGLLFLWLGVCQSHLIRLRRTAHPITDGPATVLLIELAPHPPLLLTHSSVHSPFLAGTRRPAIFLPPAFAADFGPDALRAVFLHELAHRDRRDNLWTLAARILTAILWFQPLLWLLCRRLEQISEDACDQAVLAAHCPPRAYAACLLSLAGRPPLARFQRTLTAGVAPFRSSVGRRISRILTQGVPSMPAVTLRLRLSIAALTVAAATGGAFLVSSAPAQTQPKPAPVVTPEMLTFHAERMQDLANLKAIGLALVHYEARNPNYRLPDAKHWMDQIMPYLPDRSVLFDPFQPGKHRYGYAFNRNCSKQSLTVFDAPAETVAVYASSLGTRNASDTGQSAFSHSVQRPGMTPWTGSGYGFVDGHAKWFITDVHPSFSLKGGEKAGSELPANPSVVGTWLCSHDDGTGNVLIFSPNGTIEEVGPWPGSSTAVDHSYGPNSVVGHSYGHYRTAGPNLMYTFNRVWVEGEKPWTGSNSEKHRQIYSISGNTLILRWNGNKSVSHRIPAYTKAMLGLKPSTSAVVSLPDKPLNQAQFLAGLTPVQGPGVVVTLTDSKKAFPYPKGFPAGMVPPNLIHDSDINQTVNELKAAGAEAISVNNQRLVATSAVRSAGPALLINNTPQEPPFVIKAIGDPKTLAGALNIPGGITYQLKNYDPAMFTVQQAATLTLPAYTGGDTPRYAKLVSAADVPAPPAPPSKVVVTLDSEGFYLLDGVQLPEAQIEPFLAARARQNPNITAVIKVDKNQPYSRVVKLLDSAKQAGIQSTYIASPTSSSVQPARGNETTPTMAQTHTIIGYGLVSFMLSKHLYCHAVEHSEAARLGVPIKSNSEIIGVNGGPVPKTAAQFVAICRTAPPLRLLLKPVELKNFTHTTQSVTFQTQTPFTVITDAARAEELGKGLKSAQADAATAKAALAHANEQLTDGVHALLPQAPPATLAKALNLERQIGWSMHRMSFAKQYVAWSLKKHNPKSKAMAINLEKNIRTYLDPETAEEAQIFPQTADSRQQLAQIHVLAKQIANMQITVTIKQDQAQAIASVMQQRSPDVAV